MNMGVSVVSKKVLFIVVTTVVAAISMGVVLFSLQAVKDSLKTKVITRYSKHETSVAKTLALQFEDEIALNQKTLELSAEKLTDTPLTQSSCFNSLIEQQSTASQFSEISYYDQTNRRLCSTNDASTLTSTNSAVILQREPENSHTTKNPITHKYALILTTDVIQNSTPAGRLVATIPFDRLSVFASQTHLLNNQLSLWDSQGNLLFHTRADLSGKSLQELRPLIKNPEVFEQNLTDAKKGVMKEYSYVLNDTPMTAAFVPIEYFPGERWIFGLSVPLSELEASILNGDLDFQFVRLAVGVSAFLILAFFIILWYLIKNVFNPIETIRNGLQQLASGNLTVRVVTRGSDEIGKLGIAFNEMAEKLQWYSKGLEEKAQQKTQEVERKIEELEKLNKFMTGRELKMAELKQEITNLKRATDSELAAKTDTQNNPNTKP